MPTFFRNIHAIQKTVPSFSQNYSIAGRVIYNGESEALKEVLEMGAFDAG